ncbi:HNH endonuclease, partial [bacterium]|nr:HNH endonuclease [bacterium]
SSHLGKDEIADRARCYPTLAKELTRTPIDMEAVGRIGKVCWTLGQQHDAIRFGEFVSHPDAAKAIGKLISDFPSDDASSIDRIDVFMEECVSLGYRDRKSNKLNSSSAGLLASTILTALFPRRFVDFRQGRWKELADELNYGLLNSERPSYGEMVVAAGFFAQQVCATDTFLKYWTDGEPLWIIAGICWHANSATGADRPKEAPIFPYEEDFDEGAMALRSHLIRERSTSVVNRAKAMWQEEDPMLKCDICGFSFVEVYGEFYIEAHHTKPINLLKAGSRTKPSDLAKVCANCHRMIHLGNQCRELSEVRSLINKPA